MKNRWPSFLMGVVAATLCLMLGWGLFRVSSAGHTMKSAGRTDSSSMATIAETPAERRTRLEAWADALNTATPEESWATKAPGSRQEAAARLKAIEEARALSVPELKSLLDREMGKPAQTTIGTIRLLIGSLVLQDPEGALRWMKGNLNQNARWDACWRDAGQIWALNNPMEFSEWLRNGKAVEYREQFDFSVHGAAWLALRDIGLGAELMSESRGNGFVGNDEFAEQIVTPEDVAAVRAVLARNPPPPPKTMRNGRLGFDESSSRALQHSLERAWPTADPEGWRAHLATHPRGAYGEDLWLVEQVKQLDGKTQVALRAEQILGQLPPDTDREAATLAIVRQWSATDPQAAVNWASAKLGVDSQERLVSTIARTLSATDPGAALDLWQQLPESPRRNDNLAKAFDQWHIHDPAAADDFRQTTAWSEDVSRAIHQYRLTRPVFPRSSDPF